MKTEEATCKVAPSPTQISYPLYNVKDGVIEDSPHTGVTCSPCSIESPQTQKLYITPPPQGRKKPKDPRFACLGYIQKLKRIPSTAKAILTWLVMERQWRDDRLIIVSFGLVADHFGLSRRQVIRLFQILEESGCLRIFKRGGIRGGTRYEGNTYALGSLFDNLPPEESFKRPVTKMSPIKGSPSVTKMSIEQCQECHPLPIVSPYKNTHTEELPSAFTKENWLKACQKVNPSRDLKDIERTFPLALRKGAKDGDWMYLVEHFDSFYTPRSAPAGKSPSSAVWVKQPKKGFEYPMESFREDWEVPHPPDCNNIRNYQEWIDAGAPDSYARYNGTPAPYWQASFELLNKMLTARKEGKKFIPADAVARGIRFKHSDWCVAFARFKAQTAKAS